jgi:hypothetical protein
MENNWQSHKQYFFRIWAMQKNIAQNNKKKQPKNYKYGNKTEKLGKNK